MKSFIFSLALACTLVPWGGCNAAMRGWTQSDAMHKYLGVDPARNSLGYRRLTYLTEYYPPLKQFVASRGTPTAIYSFKDGAREGVWLLYSAGTKVFVFIERDQRPASLYLKEERGFTWVEYNIVQNLNSPRDPKAGR